MKQYTVTGMSCAACSARVEKAVSKVDGVSACSVSLLTNSMGVEGDADSASVIRAVEEAGYGAALKEADREAGHNAESIREQEKALEDEETPKLKKRLFSSIGFLIVLMYFSMGHMMFGWPLPAFFEGNHVAMGLVQLLLTIMIMVINQKFFVSGFKSLFHRAPNMDTLVAMGSSAAFLYSTYALFAMTDAQVKGDMAGVMKYMDEFYFESAAMILTLITVGKMLEAHSKGKTTDALKGLMKLAPQKAILLIRGEEKEVPVDQVKKGDLFLVKPGENIPVDGIVVKGSSAVNEAALTGESIPVDKAEGDEVSAATINQSGVLTCEAVRVGEDTALSRIIQMVSDAAATKAPIARIADKVSGIFVPAVIAIAAVTFLTWILAGQNFGYALARAISVLVISCPCALGLATPVAIMVGNGMGARNGILFKTAASLEETGKTEIVVLDKTGTITKGEPRVTDILPAEGVPEECLLTLAYSLEKNSEHPLAGAVVAYAGEKQLRAEEVTEFQALPGNGLLGRSRDGLLTGGSFAYISSKIPLSADTEEKVKQLAGEGKTPLLFGIDNQFLGMIAVADVVKEDSTEAVKELTDMGIRVIMLTGDNERTARAVAARAGIKEVIAGVLPDGKEQVVRSLKEEGRVAMAGDGINDALALTRADVGIAIGAGTDVAIDAADVVLMKSSLKDIPAAVRLSRATLRNIHENLFWAFIYNIIGIPLAAGVWIPLFHWQLNPMFGAAAMSLSSFCVVTNALRLNLFKVYDSSHDRKQKGRRQAAHKENTAGTGQTTGEIRAEGSTKNIKKEEDNEMKKTMKIEGMMCGHCEAAVKKALEAVEGVESALVSHEKGSAEVTLTKEVADDVLKKAVEDKDYKVTAID
mgnify:FL=1